MVAWSLAVRRSKINSSDPPLTTPVEESHAKSDEPRLACTKRVRRTRSHRFATQPPRAAYRPSCRVGGSARHCSLSRRGRSSNSMRSVTHKTQVPELRHRTAQRHGGTTGAAAPPAAWRTETLHAFANGGVRKLGCPSRSAQLATTPGHPNALVLPVRRRCRAVAVRLLDQCDVGALLEDHRLIECQVGQVRGAVELAREQ
jgi:hypothetical protein